MRQIPLTLNHTPEPDRFLYTASMALNLLMAATAAAAFYSTMESDNTGNNSLDLKIIQALILLGGCFGFLQSIYAGYFKKNDNNVPLFTGVFSLVFLGAALLYTITSAFPNDEGSSIHPTFLAGMILCLALNFSLVLQLHFRGQAGSAPSSRASSVASSPDLFYRYSVNSSVMEMHEPGSPYNINKNQTENKTNIISPV